MNKAYNRINGGKGWENAPSIETPLNKQNLDRVDIGLDEVDNRVIALDTTKFNKAEAQGLIKSLTFNSDNGVFTVTYYNGATAMIDTLLEKLAVNFDFDETTQRMVIYLSDGTEKYVDLSAFLTPLEFIDSGTIDFQILQTGKVTAIVKEGSIQEKHLQPNYLADIKAEVAKAEASATAAEVSKTESATSASTAIAKAGEAATSATNAANSAVTAMGKAEEAADSADDAEASAATATQKATDAGNSADAAVTSATNAAGSASTATEKANAASASATAAARSATSADIHAKQAQSYAVGTGGVRPGEATDNAKYYYEQSRDISQGIGGALIPMGTVAFANLPLLADVENGWMYNISDEFVTDSAFKEGVGHVISAGSNVYKTADGFWDVLSGTPVTTVNGQTGNVNITPESIDAVSKSGDTMTGKLHAFGGLAVNETTTGFTGNPPYLLGIDSHADGGTVHYKETEYITVGRSTKAVQDENGNNLVSTYQTKTGDTKDNKVSFTSGDAANPAGWTDVELMASGEKHSSLWRKVSLFAKNVRYLWKLLGKTSLDGIGDSTVTGAISMINADLTIQYGTVHGNYIDANWRKLGNNAFRVSFGGQTRIDMGANETVILFHLPFDLIGYKMIFLTADISAFLAIENGKVMLTPYKKIIKNYEWIYIDETFLKF